MTNWEKEINRRALINQTEKSNLIDEITIDLKKKIIDKYNKNIIGGFQKLDDLQIKTLLQGMDKQVWNNAEITAKPNSEDLKLKLEELPLRAQDLASYRDKSIIYLSSKSIFVKTFNTAEYILKDERLTFFPFLSTNNINNLTYTRNTIEKGIYFLKISSNGNNIGINYLSPKDDHTSFSETLNLSIFTSRKTQLNWIHNNLLKVCDKLNEENNLVKTHRN